MSFAKLTPAMMIAAALGGVAPAAANDWQAWPIIICAHSAAGIFWGSKPYRHGDVLYQEPAAYIRLDPAAAYCAAAPIRYAPRRLVGRRHGRIE